MIASFIRKALKYFSLHQTDVPISAALACKRSILPFKTAPWKGGMSRTNVPALTQFDACKEHRRIIEAIESGRSFDAYEAVRYHLDITNELANKYY